MINTIRRKLADLLAPDDDVITFTGWQAHDGERPTVDLPDEYDYGGSFTARVNGDVAGVDFDIFVEDVDTDPRAYIFVGELTREWRLHTPERQPELAPDD